MASPGEGEPERADRDGLDHVLGRAAGPNVFLARGARQPRGPIPPLNVKTAFPLALSVAIATLSPFTTTSLIEPRPPAEAERPGWPLPGRGERDLNGALTGAAATSFVVQ